MRYSVFVEEKQGSFWEEFYNGKIVKFKERMFESPDIISKSWTLAESFFNWQTESKIDIRWHGSLLNVTKNLKILHMSL